MGSNGVDEHLLGDFKFTFNLGLLASGFMYLPKNGGKVWLANEGKELRFLLQNGQPFVGVIQRKDQFYVLVGPWESLANTIGLRGGHTSFCMYKGGTQYEMIWKEFFGKDLVAKPKRRVSQNINNCSIAAERTIAPIDPHFHIHNNHTAYMRFRRQKTVGNHFDQQGRPKSFIAQVSGKRTAKHKLRIASWFARMYLTNGNHECNIFTTSGKRFTVSYIYYTANNGNYKYNKVDFKSGWAAFAQDNKISSNSKLEFIILPGWWENNFNFEVILPSPLLLQ